MSKCFRTPESYNILLYAMTNGSELAAYSGYPKNKCDKYIKALCEVGLVHKEPERNGYTKYYPANSYIALWYKVLLSAVPNPDGTFGEDVYDCFMKYLNAEIVSPFYKNMCVYWLGKNINSLLTEYVTFDFACAKKRGIYAY